MRLQPNTIVSDRYQIIELIGVGGMANVYCAKDLKLDRNVSFKVLKEEFVDEEFIGKFSKEARAAARIAHINIASVYDVGNDGNIYYIVMEYVDGYTLKDIIKAKAPFSNEEVLGISIQIANALEIAHANNIVHRDIKPQNILVTKDGSIKVTDFGIARATTSNTITTDTMGSVHYFSPEQARGGYVDYKSDIYSLGIIMYEMITGKLPFDGEGVVQLAMKHINDPLPDMRILNPRISNSLEKIVLKATAKNTDNRYSSARELNNDLKTALSDTSGNFVTENVLDEDSPTVVIRPEELEEIQKRLNNPNYNDNKYLKDDRDYRMPYNNNKQNSMPKSIDKKIEKKVTLFAIFTAFGIIALITAALVTWFLSSSNSKVPDFKGKTWDKALELAKDKELYITNSKEEYSDKIPENFIIDQDIKPNKKVKKGTNINLTLSLGTGEFRLENYVGLDISEVYKKISTLDMNVKEEYIYDEKTEIGKVIRQVPTGGSKVKNGQDLTLYISKGSEKDTSSDNDVIVPYLVGLTEKEAKKSIKNAGLSFGKVNYVTSDKDKGIVIEQSINSGNAVPERTSISLVVSSGKKETTTASTETTTLPIIEESSSETTTIEQTTIEQTTIEQTTEPIRKSDTLIINPNIPEGTENIDIKVIEIVDGKSNVIWSGVHSAKDLPINISVSGYKPTQYELYVNDVLIGTETKNFN